MARELAARRDAIARELPRLAGLFDRVAVGVKGRAARHLGAVRAVFDEIRAGAPAPGAAARDPSTRRGVTARLEKLRTLTRGYAPPEDATSDHRELYCGLANLEHELTLALQIEDGLEFMLGGASSDQSSQSGSRGRRHRRADR